MDAHRRVPASRVQLTGASAVAHGPGTHHLRDDGGILAESARRRLVARLPSRVRSDLDLDAEGAGVANAHQRRAQHAGHQCRRRRPALADLRAQTEGDIGVGGATLATALLRAGLLDELLLFTHPVILGAGRPLFDSHEPLELDLVEQVRFDQGVTLHRYAVRRLRA
ncbi:dihydrofolate reductase family protein [Luedemannella flava]